MTPHRGPARHGELKVLSSYRLIPSRFREDATPKRYRESMRVPGRFDPEPRSFATGKNDEKGGEDYCRHTKRFPKTPFLANFWFADNP